MKTKIKRHSRSVIAVVLTLCMLVSCMTVGIIATDAAKVTADEAVGASWTDNVNLKLYTDSPSYKEAWTNISTINEHKTINFGDLGRSNLKIQIKADDGAGNEYYLASENSGVSGNIGAGFENKWWKPNQTVSTVSFDADCDYEVWWNQSDSNHGIQLNIKKVVGNEIWTVVGSNAGIFGVAWDTGSENHTENDMTYDSSSGKYVKKYSNVALTGSFDYKIVKNHTWVTAVPQSGNQTCTVTTPGHYDIQFEYDGSTLTCKLTAYHQLTASTASNSEYLLRVSGSTNISNVSGGINSGYYLHDSTATVRVTPTSNTKKVSKIVIGDTQYTPTDNGNGSYIYSFPVTADKTISAILDDKTDCRVNFSANPSTQGTVTAVDENGNKLTTGNTVLEGTKVTFTASANEGYTFTGWSDGLDSKKTVETKTITAETTVTGNFGKEGYKLYKVDGTTSNMTSLSNGWYISEKIPDGTIFTIQRNADSKYVNANGGNNTYYKWNSDYYGPDKKDSVSGEWETWATPGTTPTRYYQNNSNKTLYFVYDPATDMVWTTTEHDALYPVTIYVKNGTVRKEKIDNVDKYTTTCLYGTSTVTGADTTDEYGGHVKKIELTAEQVRSAQITITTTVNSAYQDKFYVKGFDVNGGVTQAVIAQEYDDDYNELTTYVDDPSAYAKIHNTHSNSFVLNLADYPDEVIEVTPIYFPMNSKSTDFIRFYAYDFTGDVKDVWDSRLAVYPYIEGGYEPYLHYPGQLMVNEGGVYYADIPAKDASDNLIQGLTMNNYTWDDVHYDKVLKSKAQEKYGTSEEGNYARKMYNRQTYDYSEFAIINKIYHDPSHINLIDEDVIFTFKYKPEVSLENSNLGRSTYYKDSASDKQNTALDYRTSYNTLEVEDPQWKWENLTDYYKNRVDIFGQKVDIPDNDTKAAYNPIRIVSNGYDRNATGEYATAWALYKPVNASGQVAWTGAVDHYELFEVIGGQGIISDGKATHQSESYLIDPEFSTAIKEKYGENSPKIMNCERIPVMITYEYEGHSDVPNDASLKTKNDWGHRSDGRWYYSDPNQLIAAHSLIEISDTKINPVYRRDYYQADRTDFESASGYVVEDNAGQTGITANFTNSNSFTLESRTYENADGYTRAYAVSNGKHKYNLTTAPDPDGNYTFEGWYLKNGDNYTFITSDPEFSVEAKTNDVYVARYYKTPAGNLNITHNLHPDSTGTANCYAKVEVMNGDNAVYTYDETTNPIKVTNTYMKSDSANTLRITLRTVPNTLTNLQGFYMKLDSEIESLAKKGVLDNVTVNINDPRAEATAVITTKAISQFFDSTTGEQKVKALPFYSKLEKPQYKYTIEYTYTSRLWGQQKYVQAGDITSDISQYFNISGDGTSGSLVAATKSEFLSMMAPYEDNFKQGIIWKFDTASEEWLNGELTIRVGALIDQTDKTFKNLYNIPYATALGNNQLTITAQKDSNGRPMKTTTADQQFDATYGQRYTLNNAGASTQFLYAVPEINSGTVDNPVVEYFQYWEVRSIDGSKLIRKCYSAEFNLTFYEAYKIVAIYDSSKTTPKDQSSIDAISASITFLENSRNQWNHTYGGSVGTDPKIDKDYWNNYGDRVFSDFVLNFTYNDLMVSTTGNNVQTNIVIERVCELNKKDGSDEYDTANLPIPVDDGRNDVATYLNNGIKGSHVYVIENIDKSKIDNKNCIEYYYHFANVKHENMTSAQYLEVMADFEPEATTNKNYLYRAYATIKDATNTVVSVPVYFTIYDMASIENYSQNAKANGGKS